MSERTEPNVDRVTPEFQELLERFSDQEIATGVIESGAAVSPDVRHTAEGLLELLNEARGTRSGG
jgi:hypothetical protein